MFCCVHMCVCVWASENVRDMFGRARFRSRCLFQMILLLKKMLGMRKRLSRLQYAIITSYFLDRNQHYSLWCFRRSCIWFITKFHRYSCLLMPVLHLCNVEYHRFGSHAVNITISLYGRLQCCFVLIPICHEQKLKCVCAFVWVALNTPFFLDWLPFSLSWVLPFTIIQTKCLESSFAEYFPFKNDQF